jgi:hypothetical protein
VIPQDRPSTTLDDSSDELPEADWGEQVTDDEYHNR